MSKLRFNTGIIVRSERARFRRRDQFVYLLVSFFSLGGLVFPFIQGNDNVTIEHPGCAFKAMTTLPCPSCGYSRSLDLMVEGNWGESFLYNPFTIFFVILMAFMFYLGTRSLIEKKHYNFSKPATLLIMIVLVVSWVVKFIIGPEYY